MRHTQLTCGGRLRAALIGGGASLVLVGTTLAGTALAADQATTTPTTEPTVATDRPDYVPGEAATITGSGWTPGETVALEFVESPLVHPAEVIHTIADNAGNIYAGYVVDDHDLGRTFTLTATGQTSGKTAQTTFTDAGGNHAMANRLVTSAVLQTANATWTISVNSTTQANFFAPMP